MGIWVGHQRKTIDKLETERKSRLEGLPGWVWNAIDDKWEKGFQYLSEFARREGHCKVSALRKTADGYPIGTWVSVQRIAKEKLPHERKIRLEAIPGWIWDIRANKWDEGYRNVKEFVEREGHAKVPKDFKTAVGYQVGNWVDQQRINKDKLTPERKIRLDALTGWSWNPYSDQWEDGFRYLVEFVYREGHCLPPANSAAEDGFRLGGWVSTQRANKENLSPEQKARLEALPCWSWDPLSDKWEKGFRYLKEFANRERHANIPQKYKAVDGYRVGAWVSNQRSLKDSMPLERKSRLEALPGWVWRVKCV